MRLRLRGMKRISYLRFIESKYFEGSVSMNNINQKLIDAVIEKAEKVCPGSVALIGIYGSVATGDAYEKSDLDLLILF